MVRSVFPVIIGSVLGWILWTSAIDSHVATFVQSQISETGMKGLNLTSLASIQSIDYGSRHMLVQGKSVFPDYDFLLDVSYRNDTQWIMRRERLIDGVVASTILSRTKPTEAAVGDVITFSFDPSANDRYLRSIVLTKKI